MNKEELHIIDEFRSGNHKVFEKLFKEYFPRLTLHAFKIVGNKEIAEDLVQEFFVNLYDSRDKIRFHSSIKYYFYQSVRNSCLNHLKQSNVHLKYQENITPSEQPGDLDPDELMAETELETKIAEIILHLPPQCKNIYSLSRHKNMKNAEIATNLNISVRTVETQISKALKILRKELGDFLKILIFIALLI